MESRTQPWRPRTQKQIRGQGPTFCGQTLSRPRIGTVEAKAMVREYNFSEIWLVNFVSILNAKMLKILHFVKFLMIIRLCMDRGQCSKIVI